jgi:hypothetical protein
MSFKKPEVIVKPDFQFMCGNSIGPNSVPVAKSRAALI